VSWLYSRALVAAFLAGTCSDGGPSAPSNSTPMPEAFYWPGKTTGHSRLSRFGMTSEPLTGDRGEDVLTWFRAGFPVRTFQSRDAATGSTASGPGSGWKWPASFAKFDPDSCMWKTRQCSLLGDLSEFSETWPRSGSMRSGECSERRTLEPRTSGSGVGFWPTPAARDFRYPNAKSYSARGGGRKGEQLPNAVGGPLNPPWVEWLMGWPVGWTDLKPLETDRFQAWRRLHGFSWGASDGL